MPGVVSILRLKTTNRLPEKLQLGMNLPRLEPELCFEGGAIEVNGQGLVLSTTSCAGDPNRNSEGSAAERLRSV